MTESTSMDLPMRKLDDSTWEWLREPASVVVSSATTMSWRSVSDSDFWRLTAGGPVKHDGNAYVTTVSGDFVLSASFDAQLTARYDQVGLIVIANERSWLKASFELEGGAIWKGAVHTRDYSDWSCQPASLPGSLRVERADGTITVCSVDEPGEWQMLRQLFLDGDLAVGPYSAAPTGSGFDARMDEFVLRGVRPS